MLVPFTPDEEARIAAWINRFSYWKARKQYPSAASVEIQRYGDAVASSDWIEK
jgi:hypothetical protein